MKQDNEHWIITLNNLLWSGSEYKAEPGMHAPHMYLVFSTSWSSVPWRQQVWRLPWQKCCSLRLSTPCTKWTWKSSVPALGGRNCDLQSLPVSKHWSIHRSWNYTNLSNRPLTFCSWYNQWLLTGNRLNARSCGPSKPQPQRPGEVRNKLTISNHNWPLPADVAVTRVLVTPNYVFTFETAIPESPSLSRRRTHRLPYTVQTRSPYQSHQSLPRRQEHRSPPTRAFLVLPAVQIYFARQRRHSCQHTEPFRPPQQSTKRNPSLSYKISTRAMPHSLSSGRVPPSLRHVFFLSRLFSISTTESTTQPSPGPSTASPSSPPHQSLALYRMLKRRYSSHIPHSIFRCIHMHLRGIQQGRSSPFRLNNAGKEYECLEKQGKHPVCISRYNSCGHGFPEKELSWCVSSGLALAS